MQHLGRIGWAYTEIKNRKSRRVNHKDSFSVITGFGAFCKYYRQKIFWWERDLEVSIPSAWLFLEGLKSWGDILDPLQVTEKFPQLQQGQDYIVPLKEMEKVKCQWIFVYLITCTCSVTASGSLVNQKNLKKIKTHYAVCVLCFSCPVARFQSHGKAELGVESTVWLGISCVLGIHLVDWVRAGEILEPV